MVKIVVYNHTAAQAAEVHTIVEAVQTFHKLRATMPYQSVCAIYSTDCLTTSLMVAHNAKKYFKIVEVIK